MAKWRAENPELRKERARKHARTKYAKDPARVKAANLAWQRSSGYQKKPHRVAYARKYAKDHYEGKYKRNPDMWAKSKKKYLLTEKGRLSTSRSNSKRRVSMKSAYVEDVDIFAIAKLQAGLCYLCSEPMGSDITIDHVVPVSSGGVHAERNCAACHGRCNSSKRDLGLIQFLVRRRAAEVGV